MREQCELVIGEDIGGVTAWRMRLTAETMGTQVGHDDTISYIRQNPCMAVFDPIGVGVRHEPMDEQ
jgi:hypothetical protein